MYEYVSTCFSFLHRDLLAVFFNLMMEKMRYIGNTPRFGKTTRMDLGKVRMYEDKRQLSEVVTPDEQQASEEVLQDK